MVVLRKLLLALSIATKLLQVLVPPRLYKLSQIPSIILSEITFVPSKVPCGSPNSSLPARVVEPLLPHVVMPPLDLLDALVFHFKLLVQLLLVTLISIILFKFFLIHLK